MKTPQNELGKAIRIGLARKGLTQKDLAKYLGISAPSISAWMSGKTMPSAEYLIKLTEYLDISENIFQCREKKTTYLLENNIGKLTTIVDRLERRIV